MLITDLPQDRNARFVAIRRPLIQLTNRCRHTPNLRPLLRAQLEAVLAELDKQDTLYAEAQETAEINVSALEEHINASNPETAEITAPKAKYTPSDSDDPLDELFAATA